MSLSFADFQNIQKEFSDHICQELFNILEDCREHELDTNSLILKLREVSKKIKSQIFRVAIVGEFNRGKSTLINALVGENIQVIRQTACSGVITILRYGKEKRIICYYKDGSQKEIDFEEYKNLSTIPEEAAIKHLSEELARLQIEQIIFEHPNLEMCKNGVELVDSPGLNEHPERAEITKKLLNNTDAVIFITFAEVVLAETERNVILDLKNNLTLNDHNKPALSLFIVVNKIDKLDLEEDPHIIEKIKMQVKAFSLGDYPIISDEDKIHLISAKEAFKAIINQQDNEFFKSFQDFVKALESFLVDERGLVKINQAKQETTKIIDNILILLNSYKEELNQKLKDIENEKRKILEEIGDLSGLYTKVTNLIKQWIDELKNELKTELKKSWDDWIKYKLKTILSKKSINWPSPLDSTVWEQEKIVNFYTYHIESDLLEELKSWFKDVKPLIKNKLEVLDNRIVKELQKFDFDYDIPDFNYQFNFQVRKKGGYGNFFEWIGAMFIFDQDLFRSRESIRNQIKNQVIEEGIQQFKNNNQDKVLNKVYEKLEILFQDRMLTVDQVMNQAIINAQSQLQQIEIEYKQQLQTYETEVNYLEQKLQQITEINGKLQSMLF
jgi:predicted GTPase